MNDDKFLKRVVVNLMQAGARSLKLSKRQEMKLREWIIPYTCDELGLSSESIKIQELRKFIDQWERVDLSPEKYEHYYVDKNSDGKSLWDVL